MRVLEANGNTADQTDFSNVSLVTAENIEVEKWLQFIKNCSFEGKVTLVFSQPCLSTPFCTNNSFVDNIEVKPGLFDSTCRDCEIHLPCRVSVS